MTRSQRVDVEFSVNSMVDYCRGKYNYSASYSGIYTIHKKCENIVHHKSIGENITIVL